MSERAQCALGTLISANRTLIGLWVDWISVRLESISVPQDSSFPATAAQCPLFGVAVTD